MFDKTSSSSDSSSSSSGLLSDSYCITVAEFDPNLHELASYILFWSASECEGTSSSSSSSAIGFDVQPQNNSISVGQGVSNMFSVTAFGPVESYQWQHSVDGGLNFFDINPNGGVFTGALTSTLGINPNMADTSSVYNGAKFRCVITGGGQTRYSDVVTLTVNP